MTRKKTEGTTPAAGESQTQAPRPKAPPRPLGRPLRTLADLAPDPDNPREITEENAAGLTESLREYGDLAGITFNTKTGQLVTGHQRVSQLTAAHELDRKCLIVERKPEYCDVIVDRWEAFSGQKAKVRHG